jgi:hypothetical protein
MTFDKSAAAATEIQQGSVNLFIKKAQQLGPKIIIVGITGSGPPGESMII